MHRCMATETSLNNSEKFRQATIKVYLEEYSSMNDEREEKNLHIRIPAAFPGSGWGKT